MSGIKWIQLFFILLGVNKTHQQSSVVLYSKPGDTVNLRCNNDLPDDPGCTATMWLYEKNNDGVVVAQDGLIKITTLTSSKENRMSLESNCSLTVKDITAEDVGLYTCQQYVNGIGIPHERLIDLSVLSITRGSSGTKQTLTCSLFEHYESSCATLSWVKEDGTLFMNDDEPGCSTTTLTISNNLKQVRRCQVTVGNNVKTFIDFPGDLKTTQTTNPPTGTSSIQPPVDPLSTVSTTRLTPAPERNNNGVTISVVVVVVVVVVVMATALLIRFVVKRKNTPTHNVPLTSTNQRTTTTASRPGPSANRIAPADGLTYASVVHTNQTRAAVGGAKTHGADDDMVTYTTVKSPSSNDLYAKVDKTTNK